MASRAFMLVYEKTLENQWLLMQEAVNEFGYVHFTNSSNIIPITFNNMNVRVINKNNDPWFVLIDVCKILKIKNPSTVSVKLDDDEKDYALINTTSGTQAAIIVNKSGLYSLILRSRKPEAEQFNKWVKSEVLPSLNHKPTLGNKDMLDNIIPFHFENTEVRVIHENEEVLFCLKDVCDVLNISNSRDLTSKQLDQKGVEKIYTLTARGKQELTFINEPNLYRVIFRSNKAKAKHFQDWVFNEVIPSIRKTGGYMLPIAQETPEQILSRALLLAKDTMDRQTQEIAELKPKADGYDLIATSDGSMCISNAAKHLQIRPTDLFNYLSSNKWIITLCPI